MALTALAGTGADGRVRDTIRVVIADEHPLIVAGVRRTLEQVDDIEIVGEARSGGELVQVTDRRMPDAVVLDPAMSEFDGAAGVARLRSRWPQLTIVALSVDARRGAIDAVLHAGASAYVLKSAHDVDLASVLRLASSGGVFTAPASAGGAELDDGAADGLTDRERSILRAVASGQTTPEISRELWISEHTIKFHLTNIYRKLGVGNRAGAVRWALQNGVG